LSEAADAVERAVAAAIAAGCRTGDIRAASDSPAISTHEMGQAIITQLLQS
jgi:isocitrate/isopropylmalate dehydrogenase